MEKKRRPFQGVLNILSFNRHFYVFGLAALTVTVVSRLLAPWPGIVFPVTVAAILIGMLMPLVVSAYVYDFSGYYDLHWMAELVKGYHHASLIVNINAGFDETSFLLKDKFPGSELKAFDFYDAKRHTEPAIKRARKVSWGYPNTRQIASDHIPLPDHSVDLVFLLSAVHEIRSNDEKAVFLKECRRICRPGGKVVMVEHLRDLPNFVAFSVGSRIFSPELYGRSRLSGLRHFSGKEIHSIHVDL